MANYVYIGASLDGYIADRNNGLEWLNTVPNANNEDLGFASFMDRVDAIVMGRNTYETVAGFGGAWPYSKPVFVCSHTLKVIPEHLKDKVFIIQGSPMVITEKLNRQGYRNLYIDGGRTVQGFLAADLIDEMTLSYIPILLGGGVSLFGDLAEHQEFELISSEVLLNQIVSVRYRRKI